MAEEQCDFCGGWVSKTVFCPSCPNQICKGCLKGTGCAGCTGLAGSARARVRVGWGSDNEPSRDADLSDE